MWKRWYVLNFEQARSMKNVPRVESGKQPESKEVKLGGRFGIWFSVDCDGYKALPVSYSGLGCISGT